MITAYEKGMIDRHESLRRLLMHSVWNIAAAVLIVRFVASGGAQQLDSDKADPMNQPLITD